MIGLLVTLIFLMLTETSLMRSLDGYAYDLGMGYLSDKQPSKEVVVVAIDNKSLDQLGAWPWSRDLISEATWQLAKSRPKVIGYQLPFDAAQGQKALESVDKLRDVLKKQKVLKRQVRKAIKTTTEEINTDFKLASALRSAGRTVLAMPYLAGSASIADMDELPAYLKKFNLRRSSTINEKLDLQLAEASNISPPIEILSKQVGGVGVIESLVGSNEPARQLPLIVRYGDYYLPSFPLILYARYLGLTAEHITVDLAGGLQLKNEVLAGSQNPYLYPRFYQKIDDEPAFKVFSFVDVLNGDIQTSEFRGKSIIIGITAEQKSKLLMTPTGELMAPPMITAHTLSSLLNKESFRIPAWANQAQKIAIIIVGLYLMFGLLRLGRASGFITSVFLLLLMIGAHFMLMRSESSWVPSMAAVMTLVTGYLILGGRKVVDNRIGAIYQALSGANRQLGESFQSQGQLDQAFEKFSSCEVDESLLGKIYNLGLAYERKRQFNKAVSVFKFIQDEDKNYSDVADRIEQNTQISGAVVLGGTATTATNATLILGKDGMQKPKLGRYQIDKEIGRGAMGMVYLGRDEKIGRTVAVKTMMLSEEIEVDKREAVKSRFFREAEAAGRLNHPNIVTVYDVGDEEDLAYIAMDYLKGKDLTAYCKKKSLLPMSEVFEIGMSIAEALDYAHQQHVVHRDIKPANIIYDKKSRSAQITDFGVACLTDASKTKTGTVLGSPYYMSPEQLAGKKVDGRSDLFSLGVTLYQMLAGKLPFASDSLATLMYKITNEKHPDIRSYRPDVPNCVSTLMNKILNKDIEKRFQTGKQMAAAMERCYEKILEEGS